MSKNTQQITETNRQFQLTAPPVHFARNPGGPQNSHQFRRQRFLCLPTHDQSREHCGIDVQFGKESHQNAFHITDREMFIWQRSNQAFSPLLCQARLSHQHPAWHIVDCQQIYLIVLESLDTLFESRDVVSDTLAPFPLELVRGKPSQGSSVIVAVQALFQAWPSRLRCLDGFCRLFRSPLSGMFRAVGNSS